MSDVKKGQLIILEQGTYSNQQYSGPFRVLKGFDWAERINAFKAEIKPKSDSVGNFVEWMATSDFVETVICDRHWIGEWNRFQIINKNGR